MADAVGAKAAGIGPRWRSMMKPMSRLLTPSALLVVVTVLFTADVVTATLLAERVPEPTAYLWSMAFSLSVACWVSSDRVGRVFKAPFEYETFIFFLWPLALPHYMYCTRGPKGLFQGIGVFAIYLVPYVASGFIYVLTS